NGKVRPSLFGLFRQAQDASGIPTVGDFAGNAARILSLAEQAKQRGADLAVFTELCLCGYPPQDLLERPAFLDRNMDELKALAGKIPLPGLVGYAGRVKNGAGK